MNKLIKTLAIAGVIASVIGSFSLGVKYFKDSNLRYRSTHDEAIRQNSQSFTNDLGAYTAYVYNENEFGVKTTFDIIEKGDKYTGSELIGTDWDQNGTIDQLDTSRVIYGSKLEKMTLDNIKQIYGNFTNTVSVTGKIVPKGISR